MTKTLTEQWKDGTLPDRFYYMQDYTGRYQYRYLLGVKPDADFIKYFKEVLAPVPSYDEFVQQRDFVKDHMKVLIENMNLKRKLKIATNALKDILNYGDDYWDKDKAQEALTKMKGVK